MARPASEIADELAAHSIGLNRYVGRIERLSQEGRLARTDVHRAYSGAFMSFYDDLEDALESIFVGLIMGRLTVTRSGVRPLVVARSEVVLHRVVRGDRKYVDWLPYGRSRDRAATFLSGGEPFASLQIAHEKSFESARVLRNALAHRSSHAQTQFRQMFVSGQALPPEQQQPSGYLRGQHSSGKTRFTNLVAECVFGVRSLAR